MGCFMESHQDSPTHWAEVWNKAGGYFVRHDISALPGGYALQLGHGGRACPCPSPLRSFTIVDTNGVHSSKVKFCQCIGGTNHVTQLMRAKLFPATFLDPKMAFTFSLLHSFCIHHLESAVTAYNYCLGLRHLTDSIFYDDVPDPYSQLRNAVKFCLPQRSIVAKLMVLRQRYLLSHRELCLCTVDPVPSYFSTLTWTNWTFLLSCGI